MHTASLDWVAWVSLVILYADTAYYRYPSTKNFIHEFFPSLYAAKKNLILTFIKLNFSIWLWQTD